MPLELISVELTNRCAKACWFCYNHSLPEGETRWEPAEEDAAERGFFIFEYIDSFQPFYHPYTRTWEPGEPLHVDQLPPAVRKRLKEATLADRTFAETPHIQPAEHWRCHSAQQDWQGLDGSVHPFEYPEEE